MFDELTHGDAGVDFHDEEFASGELGDVDGGEAEVGGVGGSLGEVGEAATEVGVVRVVGVVEEEGLGAVGEVMFPFALGAGFAVDELDYAV